MAVTTTKSEASGLLPDAGVVLAIRIVGTVGVSMALLASCLTLLDRAETSHGEDHLYLAGRDWKD